MLLSISEAAKLMSVCENTLRDWDESGKFRSVRTEGGHRRYSLEQVRDYLEENQKIENKNEEYCENDKLINKWYHMLEDVHDEIDKRVLAVLLENAASFDKEHENFFETEVYLWLTKASWLRCGLRKMVTVQPILGPCGLIFYLAGNSIQSEAVAAKTTMYNFKIFSNAEFGTQVKHDIACDVLKELYANTIAAELDSMILNMLPRTNIEVLQDALAVRSIESLGALYDYIIGPTTLIEKLKKTDFADSVLLYEIPTMLDPDSFLPVVSAGRYPQNKLSLPIFSPYVLITVGPMLMTGVRSCMLRAGTFLKPSE